MILKVSMFQPGLKMFSNAIMRRLLSDMGLRKSKGEEDVPVARVVLKSPTGSGKTMMAAEILRSLEDYFEDKPFAFIWAAPNKLHLQSHKNLRMNLLIRDINLLMSRMFHKAHSKMIRFFLRTGKRFLNETKTGNGEIKLFVRAKMREIFRTLWMRRVRLALE